MTEWPPIYNIQPLNDEQILLFKDIEKILLNNDEIWKVFSSKTGWKYRQGIKKNLETDLNRRYYRKGVLEIISMYNKWCKQVFKPIKT